MNSIMLIMTSSIIIILIIILVLMQMGFFRKKLPGEKCALNLDGTHDCGEGLECNMVDNQTFCQIPVYLVEPETPTPDETTAPETGPDEAPAPEAAPDSTSIEEFAPFQPI